MLWFKKHLALVFKRHGAHTRHLPVDQSKDKSCLMVYIYICIYTKCICTLSVFNIHVLPRCRRVQSVREGPRVVHIEPACGSHPPGIAIPMHVRKRTNRSSWNVGYYIASAIYFDIIYNLLDQPSPGKIFFIDYSSCDERENL